MAENGADFKLTFADIIAVIEVKTVLGLQKSIVWKLPQYIDEPIVRKLMKTPTIPATHYYLLVFAYHPIPKAGDWDALLSKLKTTVRDVRVGLVRRDESPGEELCIAWLDASTKG